jgi:peptide/nickel transport system substrate-binding protein
MAVLAATAVALAIAVPPALAQKGGGTLRVQHRDNAPSASPHEEATISTVFPFMALFNNLIMYDQSKPVNSEATLVADLATSWAWDASKTKLTFKLRNGVTWHDGKPFTAADVVCTFEKVLGTDKDSFRKNPRKVWFHNLKAVADNGAGEVSFTLGAPQPGFIHLLASGYTPVYPCHVKSQDMRTKPIGTGPFMFAEWKRNESMRVVKNPNYWKKGKPYLDAIDFRIIPNRSTRLLSFVADEFDLTFPDDITIPLLKDVAAKAPKAVCQLRPTNVSTNLIVNRSAPPFDNPKVRQAVSMALDYDAFIVILSEGKNDKGGAMLPPPDGQWGLPPEELKKLPGFGDVAKSRAEARKIMEELGYTADKPLKVKVATRDIALYRDPAVILIDQLKSINVAGELDVVDTSIWHAKVARNDYSIGLNLTGVGVDDPDAGLVENYTCASERNYTKYCNKEVDAMIFAQSRETDVAKRKAMVHEIERRLIIDVARPIISYSRLATCWQPQVKGIVLHTNSIYNGWRFEDVWLDK